MSIRGFGSEVPTFRSASASELDSSPDSVGDGRTGDSTGITVIPYSITPGTFPEAPFFTTGIISTAAAARAADSANAVRSIVPAEQRTLSMATLELRGAMRHPEAKPEFAPEHLVALAGAAPCEASRCEEAPASADSTEAADADDFQSADLMRFDRKIRNGEK